MAAEGIARAWLGTVGVNGLILLCNLGTGVLLARMLLPEGRGLLAAIQFWPDLLWSIVLLSLPDVVAFRTSRTAVARGAFMTTSIGFALALGAVTASAAWLLLPHLLGAARQEWWSLGQLFAVTYIPLLILGGVLLAFDQGELRFARYNRWRLLTPSIYACALVAIWASGAASVAGAMWAVWFAALVSTAARLAGRIKDLRAAVSWPEARQLWRLNRRFHTATLPALLGSHLDRMTLVLLWDDAAIGTYMVAARWAASGLHTLSTSFHTVLFPHLSAVRERERQVRLLARGLRYALLLLVVATLGAMLLTPWLLPLLFGAAFGGAVPVALVLLAAYLLWGMREIIAFGLRGLDQVMPVTIAELLGIGVFLACVWPLARWQGLIGVGGALLLANLAALSYLCHRLERVFGLRLRDWWGLNLTTGLELVSLARTQVAALRTRGQTGKEPAS